MSTSAAVVERQRIFTVADANALILKTNEQQFQLLRRINALLATEAVRGFYPLTLSRNDILSGMAITWALTDEWLNSIYGTEDVGWSVGSERRGADAVFFHFTPKLMSGVLPKGG